jgi:rhodanese-related sulfurtransferase
LLESPKLQLLTVADLVEEQRRGTLVLDTRPAEQFASLHIRGSMQISLMGHFAGWAAILIDVRQKLVLIAEDVKSAEEARNRLARVGIRNVVGYSFAGDKEWRKAGIDLASISTTVCANIVPDLQGDLSFQLVDVRSRAEWLKGHRPRAISLPLLDLDAKARSIYLSKPSLVYCHEGYRATTAASILLRENSGDIGVLIDGIEGWSASGLPLEMPDTR